VTFFSVRPFDVGDRIQLPGHPPLKVSHIGLLTTIGHTRNGEMLIIPNSTFQSSIVTSFKRSKNYRVVLKMAIDARTPVAKLETMKKRLKQWCRNDTQVNYSCFLSLFYIHFLKKPSIISIIITINILIIDLES